MKTTFVCLANSFKEGGRCVAGIEMNGNNCILIDGKPKWIRPVFQTSEHGQVPAYLVNHINLLDIVEIDIIKEVPDGYQSENVQFDTNSIKVIGTFPLKDLSNLCEKPTSLIFGNTDKSVSIIDIALQNNSLILINTLNYTINEVTNPFTSKTRLRIVFNYGNNQYNLPITDIEFINNYQLNNKAFNKSSIFLALSLGVQFNGMHYKLVAGII